MSKEDQAPEALAHEIQEEGRIRAERALQKAQAEAENILQAAREAGKTAADKIREDGAARAGKRSEMILHAVDQEVARRKLQGREGIIQETLEEAKRQLDAADGPDYRQTLTHLAGEAIRQMPGEAFVLRLSRNESEAGQIAADVAAALRRDGRAVSVRAVADPATPPGVMIESGDGRMAWDNTFQARMWRLRDGLRQRIAPVLFQEP